jgi:MFS family permease
VERVLKLFIFDAVQITHLHKSPFNLAVIAAGLGFFVDAFDLFLFSIYRIPSLTDLGLSGAELKAEGESLLAIQMAGMMLGGILTGMIGDRKGRVAVLFGSILCTPWRILPMRLLKILPCML